MRKVEVFCDKCGAPKPDQATFIELARAKVPQFWWVLEDLGHPTRSGPMDFCSLRCVHAFTGDPDVQAHYAVDYVKAPAASGTTEA